MHTSVRRLVMLMAVPLVCAVAGSGLFASPAFAGGVDKNSGDVDGALYNLTPYTMTKVAEATPATPCYSYNASTNQLSKNLGNCWSVGEPPATIAPGGSGGFTLAANLINISGFGRGAGFESGYDGWVTYRVDVLGGAPEYVTFTVTNAFNSGDYGSSDPTLNVWNTTAPPPANFDPGPNSNAPPATQTSNPQVIYSHNTPQTYDQTFQITGHHTVDASSDLGLPFVQILNALCDKTANTSCSFTPTTPVTWSIGAPSPPYDGTNCVLPGAPLGDEPNYLSVAYKDSQSAALTVGGGITLSTEFELFDVIGNEASVSIEAEHEWEEETSVTRESEMYIPENDIGFIWVAPTVGRITGTLVVSNGPATFTATNFTETRSGVSESPLTPAFEIITKVRPMTDAEKAVHCKPAPPTAGFGATRRMPVKLVTGQPATPVKLGQSQAQLLKALGRPKSRAFLANPCQSLGAGCDAVAGTGGRWLYPGISVVFGPDLDVTGVIYTGTQRSSRHVGVGSSPAAVRGAYPSASCSRSHSAMQCTLNSTDGGATVKTVYRFTKRSGRRYRCARVLTYLIGDGSARGNS